MPRSSDRLHEGAEFPALPRDAQLPVNRCNYPASILGGLPFQKRPFPLILDGVEEFHGRLFREHLAGLIAPCDRAARLVDYIEVMFRLSCPEELGYEPNGREKRLNATCFRMIRGWSFDSNGREAAILKAWVESRFGLRARYHGDHLQSSSGDAYAKYMMDRAEGLFGTPALESQLDVLYAYCQCELARCRDTHLRLFRGVTKISEFDVIRRLDERRSYLLLNNLSSFTSERERAEEFGHLILEVEVPVTKIFFYNRLVPHLLTGEDEYMVLGGLYEATLLPY